MSEQELYRFGGTTGWEYNAEVHRLDLESQQWTLVGPEGACGPEGRYIAKQTIRGRNVVDT